MLEDESGRLRLTGTLLQSAVLVTGAVVAVLGTENSNGDFEVIDVKVPDFPPQPERWERDAVTPGKRKRDATESPGKGSPRKKIAFISGLNITGTSADSVTLSLLTDYLLGYGDASAESSQISRLIIAGNSLGASLTTELEDDDDDPLLSKKKRQASRKYGYDASAYNASPIIHLDTFLSEVLPSIPVTLMPGENDPANFALPQQEIHRAMLPRSKSYCAPTIKRGQHPSTSEPGWLDNVTNPWQGDVEGWRFWGCSGQNVDDVLRYIDISNENGQETEKDGNARIRLMDAMLRWRCAVPTAPDTICMFFHFHQILVLGARELSQLLIAISGSYPFQDHDPFVLQTCPHVFFAGNQPQFRTTIIESASPSPAFNGTREDGRARVRLLTIPKFSETGELILLDSETLEAEVVRFGPIDTTAEKEDASGSSS